MKIPNLWIMGIGKEEGIENKFIGENFPNLERGPSIYKRLKELRRN